MNTVKLYLDSLPTKRTAIGRAGENLFCSVQIDVSSWLLEYPNGTITAFYHRPDGEIYPVTLTCCENIATWNITATETALSGNGSLELRIAEGEMLGKSKIIPLTVQKSLTGGSLSPPQPMSDWVTEVTNAKNQAVTAAQTAQSASEQAGIAATKMPYIGENNHWFEWNAEQNTFVDSGVCAKGADAPSVPSSSQYVYTKGRKATVTKHFNVFNSANASTNSVCWPWVIRVDDKLENPLGKYYMYYSTDHESGGGICLAYSDSLTSGWTDYGRLFSYNGTGHLETPSAMWDEDNSCVILYYHMSPSLNPGEAQATYHRTSTDGITFPSSTQAKTLPVDTTKLYGNCHNGYFFPFRLGNLWCAYVLMGGGNGGQAVAYSENGRKWVLDHNQLGYLAIDENNNSMFANHSTIIHKWGQDFLLGLCSNFASGLEGKVAYIALVPMADLYTPLSRPLKLFDLTDSTYESLNVRTVTVFQDDDDGKLYVFYQCELTTINVAVID